MKSMSYLNDDVASLDLETPTPFLQGKAAMTFQADTIVLQYPKTLGKGNIGIFQPPSIGSAKLAPYYDTTQSSCEMITAWSKYKAQDAQFLVFMHSPARLQAFYTRRAASRPITGSIPRR